MTLRWFAAQGSKGLYVVEYRDTSSTFDVWIPWARGFWELRLRGIPAGLLVSYAEPNGRVYFVKDGNVPQVDLDLLFRGVKGSWHVPPPDSFFAIRFPSA